MEGKNLPAAFNDTKLSEESSGFTHGAWKEALHEYVRTSYKSSESMCDIEAGGVTYKVMKKDDKVTFYDASGNTLFHVAYEQLEKEYAKVAEQQDAVKDNMPENSSSAKESSGSAKDRAKKKLEKELKKAKDKSFAEPVIGYLIKRCEEDEGVSQDVMQEHKAWEKCYAYIFSEAQKSAQKGARSCAVRDNVVYEWAEDYYHKDDKAEEERKAKNAEKARKKAEERVAKAKEKAGKKSAGAKEDSNAKVQEETKAVSDVAQKDDAKPRKNTRDIEGQLDMFSLMGI